MPILTLGFFCLRKALHLILNKRPLRLVSSELLMSRTELDRGNIANAITDFFQEDVGITQNQFNVGQQMLSLGIVLFEIPSK